MNIRPTQIMDGDRPSPNQGARAPPPDLHTSAPSSDHVFTSTDRRVEHDFPSQGKWHISLPYLEPVSVVVSKLSCAASPQLVAGYFLSDPAVLYYSCAKLALCRGLTKLAV